MDNKRDHSLSVKAKITARRLAVTLSLLALLTVVNCFALARQSYATGGWWNSKGSETWGGVDNAESPQGDFSFILSRRSSFPFTTNKIPIYYYADNNNRCKRDVRIDIKPGSMISNRGGSIQVKSMHDTKIKSFRANQTSAYISNYKIDKSEFEYNSGYDACVSYITVKAKNFDNLQVVSFKVKTRTSRTYTGVGGGFSSNRSIGIATPDYCVYANHAGAGKCARSNKSENNSSTNKCHTYTEKITFRVPCGQGAYSGNTHKLLIWDIDNHIYNVPQRKSPICGARGLLNTNMLVQVDVKESGGHNWHFVSSSWSHQMDEQGTLSIGGSVGPHNWKKGKKYTVTLSHLWYGNLIAYRLPFDVTSNQDCKPEDWDTTGKTTLQIGDQKYTSDSSHDYGMNNPIAVSIDRAGSVSWSHKITGSGKLDGINFSGKSKASGTSNHNGSNKNYSFSLDNSSHTYTAQSNSERLPSNIRKGKVYCRSFKWKGVSSKKPHSWSPSTKAVCVIITGSDEDVSAKTSVRNGYGGTESYDKVTAKPGDEVIWRHYFKNANTDDATNILVDTEQYSEYNYDELPGVSYSEFPGTVKPTRTKTRCALQPEALMGNSGSVRWIGRSLISTNLKANCSGSNLGVSFTIHSGKCFFDTYAYDEYGHKYVPYPYDDWPYGYGATGNHATTITNNDVGKKYCKTTLFSDKDNSQYYQNVYKNVTRSDGSVVSVLDHRQYSCIPSAGSWHRSNDACVEVPYDYNDGGPGNGNSGNCNEDGDCTYAYNGNKGVTAVTSLNNGEDLEVGNNISFHYTITNQHGSATKTLPLNYKQYIFILKNGAAEDSSPHTYLDDGGDVSDADVQPDQRSPGGNIAEFIENSGQIIDTSNPNEISTGLINGNRWTADWSVDWSGDPTSKKITDNLSTGDKVCSYISVDHRWSVKNDKISDYKLASNVVCHRIVRHPTLSIVGGDSLAAGEFKSSSPSGTRGSFAQYAVIAGGNVTNFGSAGYLSNLELSGKITFANTVSPFGQSGVAVGNVLNGLNVPFTNQNSDVIIDNDIGMDDDNTKYQSLSEIPNVTIYASNNIKIKGNVSEIHANLVAGGSVITCDEGLNNDNLGSTERGSSEKSGPCNNQLRIYGSVISGASPKFLRSYGAGPKNDLENPQDDDSQSANAERIIYTPNLWMVPNYANQDRAIVDFNTKNVETLPNRF